MVLALQMDEPVPQIVEEIVERPVILERIIESFGMCFSWETLDDSLPPEFVRKLRRRAQELTAFEEEEEEEEDEEEGEILASC